MRFNNKICKTCPRRQYISNGKLSDINGYFCMARKGKGEQEANICVEISKRADVPDNCSRMMEYMVMNEVK